MKRILSMLLMLFLLLGCFAGCNIAEKDPENTSDDGSRSETDKGTVTGSEDDEAWIEDIDSLDEINYFAGLMALMGGEATQMAANANSVPPVTPLNHTIRTDYWNLLNEQMTITVAICFAIEVTEEDAFLASKVGTGTISVMITDLKANVTGADMIGTTPLSMITFKNGEQYYSCLAELNDLQHGENNFFTNLYIDGFYMVKVSELDGWFSVMIHMDDQTVTSCDWITYQQDQSNLARTSLEIADDSIEFYHGYHLFTLDSLLSYYRGSSSEGDSTSEESRETSTNPLDTLHLESGMAMDRIEVVDVYQKDIPGERLSYDLLFVDGFRIGRGESQYLIFETEEAFLQFVETIDDDGFGEENKATLIAAAKQVNFENEYLIAVMARYSSLDVDENGNGFGINEVILQDRTLLFIYESLYAGGGQDDDYCQSSFLTIKKSDLPNGVAKYEIYAYSTENARDWASRYYTHYRTTTIVSYR
ncbi:MAG: hypothetical protein IJF33_07640 [Clostridia bacterium]|nr:hypothetical protein [Clostridia bacterium]